MGWMDYYRLLNRHDGDLTKATKEELHSAAKANPNDAYSARQLAEEKWQHEKEKRLQDARKFDISFHGPFTT